MKPIERDEDAPPVPEDSPPRRPPTARVRRRRSDGHVERPPERALDPEVRLQHARDLAWRALNRRDHTVAEVRALLARKRVEPATIDAVVGELCEQGYLDDARFAQRFAEDRRRLDGWGAERIERRLRALGVAGELIAAAVAEQGPEAELEAAVALLAAPLPDAAGDAARLRARARDAGPQGLRARAGARRASGATPGPPAFD